MDISAVSLRDGVLLIASLFAVYFVFQVLRLKKMTAARKRSAALSRDESEQATSVAFNEPFGAAARSKVRDDEASAAPAESTQRRFEEQMQRFGMESEFQRMQQELIGMRRELATLREDLDRLNAARSVSPLYSEAMSLAERGHDAAGIAGRCGISIAEAELVAALARNRGEFRDIEETEDMYGRQEPTDDQRAA
ncbi:hypothetical protein B9N43_14000 [Denitratisoma sp. DHT3]|uniref:DUF2802 domain-containing protein n=1 Tax=Denitratisoma sp. DHT3 TaxID=1981880 RepID=UPI0011988E8E|nr:DUF2802 domain-containing protein [Denitratisoma sp. DHT3]QDX82256.1 hypothetical protein B9N43_14000 [Denitratisoma sp. DHT3]